MVEYRQETNNNPIDESEAAIYGTQFHNPVYVPESSNGAG